METARQAGQRGALIRLPHPCDAAGPSLTRRGGDDGARTRVQGLGEVPVAIFPPAADGHEELSRRHAPRIALHAGHLDLRPAVDLGIWRRLQKIRERGAAHGRGVLCSARAIGEGAPHRLEDPVGACEVVVVPVNFVLLFCAVVAVPLIASSHNLALAEQHK